MSTSAPADLAVAFRSLPRRLKEASADHVSPGAVADAEAAVNAAIAAAATLLGSVATAEGVATAIQARKARDWADGDLATIQSSADAAARAIRALQNS